MRLRTATAAALGGYLIGSISFARLVGRKVAAGEDLSQTTLDLPGDSTMTYSAVSATSIGVRAGPLWGITTSALDIAKAYVPTLLARRRWPGESYHLVVATATLVGHNYPLYHRFKGGRGQTVIYGSVLAIDWVAVPVTSAAGMLIGFGALREIFVAYTLGMALLIPWFAARRKGPETAYAAVANALFAFATIPEAKEYFAVRKAGGVRQVSSLREVVTSHPAMRAEDRDSTGG